MKPASPFPQHITEAAQALQAREIRAADLLEHCLDRIDAVDRSVNAFITVDAGGARAAAAEADAELDAGRWRGPLHGVPVSLKDLVHQQGLATTAGSRSLRDVAPEDAPSVAHLRAAGAILVGKTNMHEFAMGTTSDDSGFGPVRHPLALSRSPGGSSGGSAVSVLTGMCLGSVGSDTGGSIRIPAAMCGLVGLKPAWGEVSLEGSVPLSPTLDCLGPITRSVDDAWMLLDGLTGRRRPPPDAPAPGRLRAAVPRDLIEQQVTPDVLAAFDAALARLTDAGVTTTHTLLNTAELLVPAYVTIVMYEALEYHAPRMATHGHAYTPRVRARLDGVPAPSREAYDEALTARARIEADVDALVGGGDVLLLPSVGIEPPSVGAEMVRVGQADVPARPAMLRLTQPFNLSRHAALSVPCGATPAGFPVGLQVVGRSTADVVAAGRAIAALVAS